MEIIFYVCFTRILNTLLKNIAQLFSGVYIKPGVDGNIYYIQAKHFDKNREFDPAVKPELRLDEKTERHLLKSGDILLAAKGYDNFAVQYKGFVDKAVASSIFIVIRIRDQKQVLPEFLTWYLNLTKTQQFFKNYSKGSDIPAITIGLIKDLEIFIPTIEKQHAVLKMAELTKRENQLRQQITALRNGQIQQQLLQVI